MKVRSRVALLVLFALSACERRSAPLCTEGMTTTCACPGAGLSGVQRCQRDGTLGPCACSLPPLALRALAPEKPPPFVVPPAAPPVIDPPATARQVPLAPPVAATPLGQARACLRNASSNMIAGNECVVAALRGRASTEPEMGLLCVTYRTMGRTADAMRCMRSYIRSHPDGPRVPSFQQYIDNNAP